MTSHAEDEYFAREDAEKKRQYAIAHAKEIAVSEKERLKELHHMRCPKCGMPLHHIAYHGIEVERCFACHCVVLDDHDLDRLVGHEGYLDSILRFFALKDYSDKNE